MTIDVTALRERLRASADAAARQGTQRREQGFELNAQYASGQQAAYLMALHFLDLAEREAYAERAAERDNAFSTVGARVDLDAVEELERFAGFGDYATETGALDQASGTVYSDADGGL